MLAIAKPDSERVAFIKELNDEYFDEELANALEATNAIIARVKKNTETFTKESVAKRVRDGIQLEQVCEAWQKVAQECLTCGVCFQVLQDPVCCANETCNYMLCRDHVSVGMRCPNRCGDQ